MRFYQQVFVTALMLEKAGLSCICSVLLLSQIFLSLHEVYLNYMHKVQTVDTQSFYLPESRLTTYFTIQIINSVLGTVTY